MTATAIPVQHKDRLLAMCVFASFLVCYGSVFVSLVNQWLTNDVYAHGFVIPIVSGYLIYERRAALLQTSIAPDLAGGSVLLGAGLLLLLIGQVGALIAIAQLSLLVSAAGAVLLLFGRRILAQVQMALVYLLFMIPVWELATGAFQGSFQLLSAQIGAGLMRLLGIPVRRDGVYLELPDITLHVADVCSGVNFVIAILAVTIPLAYLKLARNSLRVFVAVLAIVVALVSNGLRVALIGALAQTGNTGPDIHGPGHLLQGLSVAGIGFVIMFVTIHLLARHSAFAQPEQRTPTSPRPFFGGGSVAPRLAIVMTLVFMAVAVLQTASFANPIAASVSSFPTSLGTWRASMVATATAPVVSGADSEVSRRYVSSTGRAIQFYAGYFTYQVQAKELVSEQMSALHHRAGIVNVTRPDGVMFHANESIQTEGDRQRYLLFWYEISGRAIASRYSAKAWTIWNSLIHRRSDGAVVMLSAEFPSGTDRATVIRDARQFAGLAALSLQTHLPR
jgi:EpsI family protein